LLELPLQGAGFRTSWSWEL